jgi:hypothetical protein
MVAYVTACLETMKVRKGHPFLGTWSTEKQEVSIANKIF